MHKYSENTRRNFTMEYIYSVDITVELDWYIDADMSLMDMQEEIPTWSIDDLINNAQSDLKSTMTQKFNEIIKTKYPKLELSIDEIEYNYSEQIPTKIILMCGIFSETSLDEQILNELVTEFTESIDGLQHEGVLEKITMDERQTQWDPTEYNTEEIKVSLAFLSDTFDITDQTY